MSVQALTWVLENSESRLGPRHVMISIANHADRNGMNAFPSIKTISHEARLSEREVRYAIRELTAAGELTCEIGAGPDRRNRYTLPLMGGAKFAPSEGADSAGGRGQTMGQNPPRNKELTKATVLNPPTPLSEIPKSLQDRIEKERRSNLRNAERRGLRDFAKYPREDWEGAN